MLKDPRTERIYPIVTLAEMQRKLREVKLDTSALGTARIAPIQIGELQVTCAVFAPNGWENKRDSKEQKV